jgi:HPt (histidine-containing phosphotransfer) domain-containing protein
VENALAPEKAAHKIPAADAMRRAVEGFVARLPGRVDELLSLSAARDMERLRTLVHQLKGSGSGYGFPAITQTAASTEAVIRGDVRGDATGDSRDDAQLDAIRIAVDELVALLRGTAGYDASKEGQLNRA